MCKSLISFIYFLNFNHTDNIDYSNVEDERNKEPLNVSELFKNILVIYNGETVALNTNVPYLFTLKYKITEKHEFNLNDFLPGYHFNIMNDCINDKKLNINVMKLKQLKMIYHILIHKMI